MTDVSSDGEELVHALWRRTGGPSNRQRQGHERPGRAALREFAGFGFFVLYGSVWLAREGLPVWVAVVVFAAGVAAAVAGWMASRRRHQRMRRWIAHWDDAEATSTASTPDGARPTQYSSAPLELASWARKDGPSALARWSVRHPTAYAVLHAGLLVLVGIASAWWLAATRDLGDTSVWVYTFPALLLLFSVAPIVVWAVRERAIARSDALATWDGERGPADSQDDTDGAGSRLDRTNAPPSTPSGRPLTKRTTERASLELLGLWWPGGNAVLGIVALFTSFAVSGAIALVLRLLGLVFLVFAVVYRWYVNHRIGSLEPSESPSTSDE